ncbi:hypothetical protein ACC685_36360, partial [Rhizobium ruizarguesonis]
ALVIVERNGERHGLFVERIGEPVVCCRHGADAITNAVSGTHEGLNGVLDRKAAALAASLNEGQARLEEALGHRTAAIIGAGKETHDRLTDTLDE